MPGTGNPALEHRVCRTGDGHPQPAQMRTATRSSIAAHSSRKESWQVSLRLTEAECDEKLTHAGDEGRLARGQKRLLLPIGL